MKLKLWIKYLLYITIIVLIVILRGKINYLFKEHNKSTFELHYYQFVVELFINVCIGLILGMEYFIKEWNKEGRWKINIPKLILVGIPTLYLSLPYMLLYSNIPFLQKVVYPSYRFIFQFGISNVSLFQVILGFMIITSFYKKDDLILVTSSMLSKVK